MSAGAGTRWTFLVVEDNDDIANQVIEAIPDFVDKPDSALGTRCNSFKEALGRLVNERFDVLILDLKDDSAKAIDEHDVSAGLEIFENLKKLRFSPVIFYTAHAHKVRDYATSFVRVVEKTEGLGKLREEVQKILATKLPMLSRRIEEVQRSYMWDFIGEHWKEYDSQHQQADLAYLMARRLALLLQADARTLAHNISKDTVPDAQSLTIHPMEVYVHPPVGETRQAGDIVQGDIKGDKTYWLVLTPSCDFEERHPLNSVLLARCAPLVDQQEFKNWAAQGEAVKGPLNSLIGDNRQKAQPERFKFLPGTFFLPDLIADFQGLVTVTPDELKKLQVVASLDSPFAEAVLARFSRYFGRLGTPDIDKQIVLRRLEATHGLKPVPK